MDERELDMGDAITISHHDRELPDPQNVVVVGGRTAFDKKIMEALKELQPSPEYETGTAGTVSKNRAQRRKEAKQNRRKNKQAWRGV